MMQRKVRNMVNLGRTTVWIHRVLLVKSGRVQNLGGITYDKVNERGRLRITLPKKGKEKKGGGRGTFEFSRWITCSLIVG